MARHADLIVLIISKVFLMNVLSRTLKPGYPLAAVILHVVTPPKRFAGGLLTPLEPQNPPYINSEYNNGFPAVVKALTLLEGNVNELH